jgi:hypothetical protein
MPFSIEWTDDGRTVLCSGSGVVTGGEILRATETCLAQPERFRTLLRATIILAGITELEVSADDVKRIAFLDGRLAALNPRAAVAIVAPQDSVFGVARMWEAYVEDTGWQTGVFRTLFDAEAWLGTTRSSPE